MRRILISLAVIGLLLIPQLSYGGDEDDLKAAYETLIQAWNTNDAETIASMIYPGAVNMDAGEPFPSLAPLKNTEAQITQSMKMLFDSLDFIRLSPYNLQYKVVGNTGIIWGFFATNYKAKGQPASTGYVRVAATYVKSDGKWLCLLNHMSAIPLGE